MNVLNRKDKDQQAEAEAEAASAELQSMRMKLPNEVREVVDSIVGPRSYDQIPKHAAFLRDSAAIMAAEAAGLRESRTVRAERGEIMDVNKLQQRCKELTERAERAERRCQALEQTVAELRALPAEVVHSGGN